MFRFVQLGFLLASDAPVAKDAVIAVVGASAALAGLILVFLGVVINGYSGFTPGISPDVTKPYRMAMFGILAVFALSLSSTGLGLAWLTESSGEGVLYKALITSFFAQLGAIFVMAASTIGLVVHG
jgi:hypothetical protein